MFFQPRTPPGPPLKFFGPSVLLIHGACGNKTSIILGEIPAGTSANNQWLWGHEVMTTIIMMSWQWSWRHDNGHDIITMIMMHCEDNNYEVMMTIIMMSWPWLSCHDNGYDVMTMVMTSWQWSWRHDNDYDVMTS